MKKKEVRLNRLVEILQKKNGATIKELSQIFNVSTMTIRRDLEILKENGVVLNISGAAIYNTQRTISNGESYSLSVATTHNVKEKAKIGEFAASLIEDGDSIIIDNGSTMECLAENIGFDNNVTVVTSNLNILNTLCTKPNISIIFGGGYFHPDTFLFESPEGISLIRKTRAKKVFVSAAGVHDKLGITCMNSYEIETKRTIIASGAERILLVDSSKFGVIKPCFYAELSEFHHIITDSDITEDWRKIIENAGIKLTIV